VVLCVVIAAQRALLIITKRNYQLLQKNIEKERDATAGIINLSKKIINTNIDEDDFLSGFIEYAFRSMKGGGGAILKCDESGNFYGCSIAGSFPPMRPVTPQVEQQLLAHAKKHTEFFRGMRMTFTDAGINEICHEKGFAYYKNQSPLGFPETFISEAPIILLAPIKLKNRTAGLVIVVSKNEFDAHKLSESDGPYLARLTEIASLMVEVLMMFKERRDYEAKLQEAKEEGMMQVSAGIIHNIGNAVTVAKLSVLDLQEKLRGKNEDRPEYILTNEIIPVMREKLGSGGLEAFLRGDPAGSQYFDIMGELMNFIVNTHSQMASQLSSLSAKLFHISEIIELQQRFVGELGTENMTQLSTVINTSVKIFEETFNKRGVRITSDISSSVPEALIDPSMMTQVIMNIIKNAVEAMDSEHNTGKQHEMKISLSTRDDKDVCHAVIEISDNGPGIPKDIRDKIFDFGFTTKKKERGRGYGLHSCAETIKKYNGKIEVETGEGKGTTFRILLPVKRTAAAA
jgi:signal transduction histidine kinase